MGSTALPLSLLVPTTVSVTAAAAQAQNTTTLLVLTNNTVLDLVTRIGTYASALSVGQVFGTAGPEYAAAVSWFAQAPAPLNISIGRWAQTAAAGMFLGVPLSPAQQTQALAFFAGITSGEFSIVVNGAAAVAITQLNFFGVTNLNGVAAVINAGFGHTIPVVCTWNAYTGQFVFTSTTTGTNSSVAAPTTASASGETDISAMLVSGPNGQTGAFAVPGQAGESALAAVTLFDQDFGYSWYALQVPSAVDADDIAIAQYIASTSTTRHFYFITTQETATLLSTDTTSLAYQLAQLGLKNTAIQYCSTSNDAVASLAGRYLTVDYAANATVITGMYKQEPGIAPETLNQTQLANLLAKNCNVFVKYQGGATIIQPGTTCATNYYIDTQVGTDNLAISIQLAIFNLLYTSLTKIPQDDGGMQQIVAVVKQVLLEYVADGLIAPGVWNAGGFGQLNEGDTLEDGFYVYAPLLATQAQAARAARMAVPLQIAVKLAGAIQTVPVSILVNP